MLGVLLGWLAPSIATNEWIDFLGRAFVKLIKMAIAPIIFCTIVSGIAHIQEAKSVGRVGVKALVYFELVSTHRAADRPRRRPALAARRELSRARADARPRPRQSKCYVDTAAKLTPVDYILHIIPDSVVGAFVNSPEGGLCRPGAAPVFQIGDILQVLFFAVLFGFALMRLGERGHALARPDRRRRARDVRASSASS